jgi:hypothetical protein
MSTSDPTAAAQGTATAAAPAPPAPATAPAKAGGVTGLINDIKAEYQKLKSSIVHFLTSTKAGQTIVSIVQHFEALPGVQADITMFEGQAETILGTTVKTLAAGGGSATIDQALGAAETSLVSEAKAVGKTISTGALKNVMALALNNLSTDSEIGPLLKDLGL